MITSILKDIFGERGEATIEYTVLIGGMASFIMIGLPNFGHTLSDRYCSTAVSVAQANADYDFYQAPDTKDPPKNDDDGGGDGSRNPSTTPKCFTENYSGSNGDTEGDARPMSG